MPDPVAIEHKIYQIWRIFAIMGRFSGDLHCAGHHHLIESMAKEFST